MKNIILLFNALPAEQKRITWSTCCTLLRFALAPIISILLYYNYWKVGFVLFTIAALTDLLDGFLARILNEQTILGAWLDPFADKVLVISCFGTLAVHNSLPLVIPRWFVAIIAVKDILLTFGSFFFCQRNAIIAPKPTVLGKVTMATQMIFLSWILLCLCFLWVPFRMYHIFLALIFLMVVASFGQYIKWGVSILTISS